MPLDPTFRKLAGFRRLPCGDLGYRGRVLLQGCSSVGRASVSKTEGHGFESCHPCHFLSDSLILSGPAGPPNFPGW